MRVLTKSRFKLGLECPNKLFYTGKKEYANQKISDPFLEALAEGGFQVEELARMHYPGGILIEGQDGDYEILWKKTLELLNQEYVIIYEAAFLIEGLFVRTDILVKNGNSIELIEVKSKSFDSSDENIFVGKRGGLLSEWKPYLFDIAFQKYVMQLCFPEWEISSSILMADRVRKTSIDSLNQLFRISKSSENRTGIKKLVESIEQTGDFILSKKNVTDIIEKIEADVYKYNESLKFKDSILFLKENYLEDKYSRWPTSFSSCKKCEFKTLLDEKEEGLKSGFEECFSKQLGWTQEEFNKPQIFDIWNFSKGKQLFEKKIYFMDEVTKENIDLKLDSDKFSSTERQWIQIKKEVNNDSSVFVKLDGLKSEINKLNYPLHFIDFETSAVALPFTKGRKPYEQVAFQFSHHIYYENGIIEHANEYINCESGFFPNFEFLRRLKESLNQDNGTILRYANHENAILNAIYEQLTDSTESDKTDLIEFIKSISHSNSESVMKWQGHRDMVDLLEIVKKYYYNPLTKGSNSIKAVLPAVLNSSSYLQEKYSKEICEINVTSKNFNDDHIWLKTKKGKILNPYDLLPPVFEDWDEEKIESTLSEIENIANGGAALTAYSKLQFTDMEETETRQIINALLKYCELDTLAMVMIFEHFKNDF